MRVTLAFIREHDMPAKTRTKTETSMLMLSLEGRLFATVPEVAAILRWDPRTVRRHIREGKIPAVAGDNAYRVPVAWLRAQAEATGE
jgi:hypothetical protein